MQRRTGNPADDGGRLAVQDAEQLFALLRRKANLRARAVEFVFREVLHQVQVEPQVLDALLFEQRQDILASGGGEKVIGVLHTGCNALERLHIAQRIAAQKILCLLF